MRTLSMQKSYYGLMLFVFTLTAIAAQESQEKAVSIMQAVDKRLVADYAQQIMKMEINDDAGQKRQRELRLYQHHTEDKESILFYVLQPANQRNSSYLIQSFKNAEQNDLIWLYLPILKKPRRLGGGESRSPFLSSDLSYADLSRFYWSTDYHLKWLKEEQDDQGIQLQVIEALPLAAEEKRTGYKKALLYVNPQSNFVVRSIFWLTEEERLKYVLFENIKEIDGILTAQRIRVFLRQEKNVLSQTTINFSEISYKQKLNVDFTPQQLSKIPY